MLEDIYGWDGTHSVDVLDVRVTLRVAGDRHPLHRTRAAEARLEGLWREFLGLEERLQRSPAPEGAR